MDAPTSDPYPRPCAFCPIATAFPSPTTHTSRPPTTAPVSSTALEAFVPAHPEPSSALDPPCHLVLSTPNVLAFLDIMPLAPGHLLLATRRHCVKAGDMDVEEGREVGFWLPIVSKAVGRAVGRVVGGEEWRGEDYNWVQNNGERAAQVVPHVHFHLIPRPPRVDEVQSRSFTMFGRGQRTDLDDDEASDLASRIREELRREIRDRGRRGKL